VELNMFDLEQQIRSWHQALSGRFANRPDVIDELESHLRDHFDALVQEGRPPEQAWEEALHRLGGAEQLAAEFEKNRPARWLATWFATIALAIFAVPIGTVVAVRVAMKRTDPLLGFHVFAVSVGYGAVLAVGFLALWATIPHALGRLDSRRDAALRKTGARLALLAAIATAIGCALGAWWARDHLGRWWAWDPRELGGVAVLGWSLLLLASFRLRDASLPVLLLLGVMGNLVVAMSWFGPVLIETHSYGFSRMGMALGIVIVINMMALYMAIRPGQPRPARQ
jgi:hypothetical protein